MKKIDEYQNKLMQELLKSRSFNAMSNESREGGACGYAYQLEHEANDELKNTLINVTQELITTEKNYLQHLETVNNVYCEFFRKENLISTHTICKIFEQLRDVSKRFVGDLESCRQGDVDAIGRTFLDYPKMLSRFTEHFSYVEKNLYKIQEDKDIKAMANKVSKSSGDTLTIYDYLQLPLSRLSSYKLLLERIKKELKKHEISCDSIDKAYKAVNDELIKGNNAVAIESIINSKFPLIEYTPFIFKDTFKCYKPKKAEYTLFLFDKIIIFTKQYSKNEAQYKYKDYIRIKDLTIYCGEDSVTFELLDSSRPLVNFVKFSYKLKAPSDEVRQKWMIELVPKIEFELLNLKNLRKQQSIENDSVK